MTENEAENTNLASAEGEMRTQAGGNERERVKVTSGQVLIIDQFMLANEQLLKSVQKLQGAQLADAVQAFGGAVIELAPREYQVLRNSENRSILIPTGDANEDPDGEEVASVFVETGCLVFMDCDLLNDANVVDEYRALWKDADVSTLLDRQKQARDLIRKQGGAVRYGFGRTGHELLLLKTAAGSYALRATSTRN